MNADLAKDFVLGLDGEYKYIGSAMSNLTDAIRDNTTAMLQDTMELLDNKIATAEIMDQMKINFSGQTYNFSEIAGREFTNENVQREMLKQLQQNAIASGVRITGISGFNENMDVDKLEGDKLREVLDALMAQQNAKKDNENLRQEAAVDTGTTIYQKNTSAQNAYGALKSAGAEYDGMTQG
jgi:LAS superfamily LD-carboxypeptidase LdcB